MHQEQDGYGDQLASGNERAPWRPTRRQWRLTVTLLLVLGLAVGALGYARQRGHRADRDRQALANALLVLAPGTDLTGEADAVIALDVRNDGPDRVTIEGLGFDDPAYEGVDVDVDLQRFSVAALSVHVGKHCPAEVPRVAPASLTVRVRSPLGAHRELVLPLDSSASELLLRTLRRTCGLYLPGDALSLQPLPQSVGRGHVTTVVVEARVAGVLPVVLTGFEAPPGFRVALAEPLPLRLEGEPRVGAGIVRRLRLTVTVTDCAQANLSRSDDGLAPVVEVQVEGINGTDRGSVTLPLFVLGSDRGDDGPGSCPGAGRG